MVTAPGRSRLQVTAYGRAANWPRHGAGRGPGRAGGPPAAAPGRDGDSEAAQSDAML
jgi:hypothetical protein